MRLMTWCVTETHHLSVIQVFELQGCNVARLVCKDLSQIAGAEGSSDLHVGRFLWKKKSHCGRKETTCKNHARENKWLILTIYIYIPVLNILMIVFPKHKALSCKTLWSGNLAFAFMQMYKCWTLEYNEFLHTAPLLPDRKKFSFFFYSEEEEMLNPTPTVKGKSNAYLTISSVSQQDEIEILMHFRGFFSPTNGEADRHGDVIFTVWTPMV